MCDVKSYASLNSAFYMEVKNLGASPFIVLSTFGWNQSSANVFKIGVLKNFVNFTGKRVCWSLILIKFIKKRFQHRFCKTPPVAAYVCSIKPMKIYTLSEKKVDIKFRR